MEGRYKIATCFKALNVKDEHGLDEMDNHVISNYRKKFKRVPVEDLQLLPPQWKNPERLKKVYEPFF